MSNEYSEKIFQSIDTLIDAKLQGIQFDKTITGTILSQDEKDPTKYLIQGDGIKFYAFSNVQNEDILKEYVVGATVQVTIPNGDYGQRKIIKAVVHSEAPKEEISSNLFRDFILAREVTVPSNGILNEIQFAYTPKYDYLGMSVYFKTNDNFNNEGFEYIDIEINDEEVIATFSKNDILGTAEAANIEIPYHKLFTLPEGYDYSQINKITLKSNIDIGNILDHCDLKFGYSKERAAAGKLWIYPQDDVPSNRTYNENTEDKPMYIEYYDGETLYSEYTTHLSSDNLYGMTYTVGYPSPTQTATDIEQYAGTYWKQITLDTGHMSFTTNFQDKKKSLTAQYKAAYLNGETYTESEVISYSNDNSEKDDIPMNTDGIEFTLSSGNTGIYNCYGLDGNFISSSYNKEYYIEATLTNQEALANIAYVEWIIPNKSTGISPVYKTDEKGTVLTGNIKIGNQEILKDQKIYKDMVQNDDSTYSFTKPTDTKSIFTYRLVSKYYPSYNNNTIKFKVYFTDGTISEGGYTLIFGGGGTSGTPYSLNIDYAEDNRTYIAGDEAGVQLKATFARIDGEAIEIDPTFNWQLYQLPYKDENGNYKSYFKINGSNPWNADNNIATFAGDTITLSEIQNFNFNHLYYFTIIQVSVLYTNDNGEVVVIKDYFPIAYCTDNRVDSDGNQAYRLEGANRVVYGMGNDISYDTDYYDLIGADNVGNWQIINSDNKRATHRLTNKNGDQSLQPQDPALIGSKPAAASIYCTFGSDNYFIQPIVTLHNAWQLEQLNNWVDGETEVGEEFVISPFVAAGTKDTDNKFTGSVLGSVNSIWGLYGFNTGALRYRLTEDGEFFVGDGENRYIKFNNDELDIKVDGNFSLYSNDVIIDPYLFYSNETAEHIPTEKIGIGFKLGNYLTFEKVEKSNDVVGEPPYYTDWELSVNGNIIATSGQIANWTINNGYLGTENVYLSQDGKNNYCLYINDKFKVDTAGNMYATGGQIGNWFLQNEVLFSLANANNSIVSGISGHYINKENRKIFIWAGAEATGKTQADAKDIFGRDEDWSEAHNIITNKDNGAKFYVTHTGILHAKGAIIAGTIEAGSIIANGTSLGSGSLAVDREGTGSTWTNGSNTIWLGKEVLTIRRDTEGNNYSPRIQLKESTDEAGNDIQLQIFSGDGAEIYGNYLYIHTNHNSNQPSISMTTTNGALKGNWNEPNWITSGSDINIKTSIISLEQYDLMFDYLNPCAYVYIDGTSGRHHTGFIAQEVEQAILKANLTTKQFAGIMKLSEPDSRGCQYYLRRDEFVALNTWQIQKLKTRANEQEQKIALLEQEIKELKEKYETY